MLAQQVAEWQYPVGRRKTRGRPKFDSPAIVCEVAPTSMPAGRNSFADMAARERAMHFVAANGLHKNPPDLAEFQQFFSPPINFCFDSEETRAQLGALVAGAGHTTRPDLGFASFSSSDANGGGLFGRPVAGSGLESFCSGPPQSSPRWNVTVSVRQSQTATPFDYALLAACAAGWMPPEIAFTACVCMRGHGMTDREIELAFLDAAKRLQ